MAAISKAWVAIGDPAVDPDSPGDATLMTGIRDDLVHLREWIGASFFAGAVQDHNHDGVNSASIDVGPNLLRNGSFENDGAGWAITDYSGGSHAFSTSTRHHGAKSLAFTSTVLANGGGDALNGEYIAVAEGEWYDWSAHVSASGASISSRVSIVWYDAAQSQISEVNVYNVTSTPTTKARIGRGVRAPMNARFVKVRVMGGVPGAGASTGTVFFDGVSLQLSGARVFCEEQIASVSAQLDFALDAAFDSFEMHIHELAPATDATDLLGRVSTDMGSTFLSTSIYTALRLTTAAATPTTVSSAGGSGGTAFNFATGIGNSTNENVSLVLTFKRLPGGRFRFDSRGDYVSSSPDIIRSHAGGQVSADPNYFRLLMSSGNIASGTVRMYGLRR